MRRTFSSFLQSGHGPTLFAAFLSKAPGSSLEFCIKRVDDFAPGDDGDAMIGADEQQMRSPVTINSALAATYKTGRLPLTP